MIGKIEKQTAPHEFLMRWNPDGSIRGMHIIYLRRFIDPDTAEVIAERESDAMSVAVAGAAVLLDTALGQVRAATIKALQLERDRVAAAEAAVVALTAERDALSRRVAELEARHKTAAVAGGGA